MGLKSKQLYFDLIKKQIDLNNIKLTRPRYNSYIHDTINLYQRFVTNNTITNDVSAGSTFIGKSCKWLDCYG